MRLLRNNKVLSVKIHLESPLKLQLVLLVNAMYRKSQKTTNKSSTQPSKKFPMKSPTTFCTRCGRLPPHDRLECPAKDAIICHNCSKRGHFKSLCKSPSNVGKVYHHDLSDEDSPDDVSLNVEKCKFSQKSIRYLGHIIDDKGVHPDSDKHSTDSKT